MRQHVSTIIADNFTLKYYRTVLLSGDSNNGFYGIYVAKCCGKHIIEDADSKPISEDETTVNNLIKLLALNSVTPMVLCEILDELMIQ